MKFNSFLFGFFLILFSVYTFAQVPASPSASPAPLSVVVPVPAASPALVPSGSVAVAAPAAPPQWAQDLIMSAEKFPIIGPYVSKALLYAGILSSILTALVACALAILNALMGVFSITPLAGVAEAIANFKNGKVMYYLMYLSMFNAKKPEPAQDDVVPAQKAA